VHTRCFYTLNRGKRIFHKEAPDSDDTVFEFECRMFPQLMLMPQTWQRYGYTLEDIVTTYDKNEASYAWQLALVLLSGKYEPDAITAGVRPIFQSLFTFLFMSRKHVFDALTTAYQSHISTQPGSILCHERDDHKPLLPKVTVTPELFSKVKALVPLRMPSFCHSASYPCTIPFKDIHMVPLEFDGCRVLMVRVVRKPVYDAIPVKPKACIVTLPVVVTVTASDGIDEDYVMLDEACFFWSPETRHVVDANRKRKADKSDTSARKKNRAQE
jgi:hypothetical protein